MLILYTSYHLPQYVHNIYLHKTAGHLKDLSKGVIYTIKVMDDDDLNDDMDESLFVS